MHLHAVRILQLIGVVVLVVLLFFQIRSQSWHHHRVIPFYLAIGLKDIICSCQQLYVELDICLVKTFEIDWDLIFVSTFTVIPKLRSHSLIIICTTRAADISADRNALASFENLSVITTMN